VMSSWSRSPRRLTGVVRATGHGGPPRRREFAVPAAGGDRRTTRCGSRSMPCRRCSAVTVATARCGSAPASGCARAARSSADLLLRDADTGCTRQRQCGRGNVQVFLPHMHRAAQRATAGGIGVGCRDHTGHSPALPADGGLATGRIIGAEALVIAGGHPTAACCCRVTSFSVAEDSGHIIGSGTGPAGRRSAQLLCWQLSCRRSFRCTFNLSPVRFAAGAGHLRSPTPLPSTGVARTSWPWRSRAGVMTGDAGRAGRPCSPEKFGHAASRSMTSAPRVLLDQLPATGCPVDTVKSISP